jgi:predicted TIM-barrel fold metal-dependent hydrolase
VLETWRAGMTELAACANVRVKLGGIGMTALAGAVVPGARAETSSEIADRWRAPIRWCIDVFGVDRCMFESNFPVDKARYSYRVLWNAFKLMVADASVDEKAALFRGTADHVYRLVE